MNPPADAKDSYRVLIAASGTGGHLFPALSIAQAFKALQPGITIEFVGSGRTLEGLVEAAGFVRHRIATVGIKRRGPVGFLQFIFFLPKAFCQMWSIFSRLRPQVVVGVGGYVTFLPVLIGFLRRVPAWIHEAEKKPGLANYVLSFIASRVSTGFPDAKMPRSSNVVFTGQPLRAELLQVRAEKTKAKAAEPAAAKNLLVLGGSQGAQALDSVMLELTDLLKERGLSVWHQCREENLARAEERYREARVPANVVKFVDDVAAAYRWADLIISRSGAGAVMELGVVNVPAVLVPYPYAQGNHQRANAMTLVEAGKALLVEEGESFSARLREALLKLLDPVQCRALREKPYVPRALDAAEKIAQGCMELIKRGN